MARHYLKRAVGLTYREVFIQLSPHVIAQNTIDADGLYGDKPFDSLNELMTLAAWDKAAADGFMARFQELVQSR